MSGNGKMSGNGRMKLGYLQNAVIEIGKNKGFVTSGDLTRLYSNGEVKREINKLVILGFFTQTKDKNGNIIWEYIKK